MDLDFIGLFEAHHEEIARYVVRRSIDRATADDIVQETFVRAYRSRASYEPARGSPRGWLFGFARNLLKEHFKAERKRFEAYSRAASRQIAPANECEQLDRDIDFHATEGAIAAALATLNERDLCVLTMYWWAELSEEEIALAVSIPRGTVKSRLNRARQKVRAQLDPRILEANDG